MGEYIQYVDLMLRKQMHKISPLATRCKEVCNPHARRTEWTLEPTETPAAKMLSQSETAPSGSLAFARLAKTNVGMAQDAPSTQ